MRAYFLKSLIFPVLLFSFNSAFSQESEHIEKINQVEFIENKGQENQNAHFSAYINSGRVWMEKDRFTWVYLNMDDVEQMHHENHSKKGSYSSKHKINAHAFYQNFIGSSVNSVKGEKKLNHYHNYFLGNDPDKWASNVELHSKIRYKNLYEGIDLVAYSIKGNFKYDYIVRSGVNPDLIKFSYEGTKATLKNGDLILTTSVGEIIEQKPIAYQITSIGKTEVKCEYRELEKGIFGFYFPDGYDSKLTLVIDPVVIASTYSGSTATIYGHTATYDAAGNIYSAGASFSGAGYPTTAGAFQINPNGGRETAVTKYNPDGSAQIWATHVGGTGDDFPHSMVVNSNNELYILGSSASSNYPVTAGCYDNSSNGGVDIVVSVLNSTGSALLGSTYVGGSGSDGQNVNAFNYGDTYKGEITLDANGDVYVASMSSSSNFPVTAGTVQTTSGGSQDGVVLKLNADLTSLEWATYLGGSGNDSGYSLVALSNGEVYVCGSATNGFVTTPGVVNPNYLGGTHDGFIVHLNNTATAMIASTFIGTTGRDQNFFLQLDKFGQVYVNGQTDGTVTVTPGAYSGPGNGSYIMRLDYDLTVIDMVTKYGNTAMTAFLVDECNNIYAAGHGGLGTLSSPTYEVTSGAFNSSGAGFYLIVLNPNASSLLFGTFYGNSGAHVDGGTSRFDPNGIVYENVCTSAGSPTVAWAWATSSAASWDNYVFKIDFEATGVVATAQVEDFFSCDEPPFSIDFVGSGSSIPDHFWDFGDGNTSTLPNPTHIYADTGTYQVMYIAIDSSTCNIADTAYATFTIAMAEQFDAEWSFQEPAPCEDTLKVQMEFSGTGADSIIWDMGDGTIFTQDSVDYFYVTPGTYTIIMTAYDNVCNNVDTLSQTFTLDPGANNGIIFMPNVFSPNRDNKNEKYRPAYLGQPGVNPFDDLSEYHITIYDRWGLLMFESGETSADWAWDGKFKDKDVSDGTYYYIVRYKGFCESADLVEDHGFLTLFR